MFNSSLSSEEAQERIHERIKEVESYSLQKRLGYGDGNAVRWFFVIVVLLAAVAFGLF